MTEEKKDEKKSEGKEEATPDNDDGNKPEVYKKIDDANLAAKRMEEANKKKEELLNREEDLEARKALGGTTEAGGEPVKETEDEKWAKDAKIRYEGTGMDPTPDDTPTTFT